MATIKSLDGKVHNVQLFDVAGAQKAAYAQGAIAGNLCCHTRTFGLAQGATEIMNQAGSIFEQGPDGYIKSTKINNDSLYTPNHSYYSQFLNKYLDFTQE